MTGGERRLSSAGLRKGDEVGDESVVDRAAEMPAGLDAVARLGGALCGVAAGLAVTQLDAVPAGDLADPGTVLVLGAFAAAGSLAMQAALVDTRCHRLPNRLVLGVLAAGVVACSQLAASTGGPSGAAIAAAAGALRGAGGAVLAAMPLLLVRLVRGLGMGDIKFAGALGASLAAIGWWAAPLAIAIGLLAAGLWGAVRHHEALPLGPFLAAGSWATAMCSPVIGLVAQ